MENFALSADLLNFDLYPSLQDNAEYFKKIEGSNQKETFVVYSLNNDQGNAVEDQLSLLKKIFGALKFDLDKDTIHFNVTSDFLPSFNRVEKKWPVKFLVCFGISPMALGININVNYYQPVPLGDTIMIFSEDLSELSRRKEKKKALWMALKATFFKD